jgi:methionyl-tRNA formyltransferase
MDPEAAPDPPVPRLRLLFAGTPAVALPSLQALLDSPHEVVAVLTRPDAPTGRGRSSQPSPVASLARELGIQTLTPPRPSDPAFLDQLRALAPDCAPVVAYGGLLPRAALDVPRLGWVNLHFSLLPAWRGAAPVQHAVLAGDDITGATTFVIEEGLDSGPVLGTLTEPVRPDDTSGALLERLAVAGAGLLRATVDGLAAGRLVPVPQPAEGVSHAPKLRPDDARVDWTAPAWRVSRLVRACTPAPGAWTQFRGQRLGVLPVRLVPTPNGVEATPAAAAGGGLAPGELAVTRGGVLVGTATHPVLLGDVRPPGKRQMAAGDWARGARLEAGERLG